MASLRFSLLLGLGSLAGAHAVAMPVTGCPMHAVHMGAGIMPFDLLRSLHIFALRPDGGTQDVVSLDGDPEQIALIRGHLQRNARAFASGDFGTPAAIHGPSMPGLKEMARDAPRMRIVYRLLPRGARITYTSNDPKSIAAVHLWFRAQAHDHGEDAMLTNG